MPTVEQLRSEAHRKYVINRNIYNLTATDRFEDAYSIATYEERLIMEECIQHNLLEKLASLTNKILAERQHCTVKTLRRYAQLVGIKNYNHLSKASLLSALKNHENMFRHIEGNGESPIILRLSESSLSKASEHV